MIRSARAIISAANGAVGSKAGTLRVARLRATNAAASMSTAAAVDDSGIYTAEHMEMRRSLRKLIDAEINPYVDEWEAEGIFPAHDVFKKLGDGGFLGVTKPVEFGGLGLDFSYSMAIAEEMGNVHCGGVPMAVGVQTDMATPALARFGSDELRRNYLAPSIAGDYVACLGVSEAGAGSDVASTKTTARREGDEYVINGSKMWTTSGTQADWMCLLANTSDGAPHRNKSLMVLPMDAPGVSTAPRFKKLGMRSSDTTQVFFDNVRIPASHLIGEEGQGFTYQMLQFQEERMFGATNLLAMLDNCIESTIEYASSREMFGGPLVTKQHVQFTLAELQTEVEALRSLCYRAIRAYVDGQDVTRLASMAKLKGGRVSRQVADSCLQFFGGMGYVEDTFVNRVYRDVRLLSIGGGADEVMLQIIAKLNGTMAKQK